MNNIERAVLILLILIIPSYGFAEINCDTGDVSGAKSKQEINALKISGFGWMLNAKICTIGEFQVAVPEGAKDNDSNIVYISRKDKPVFYRGSGGTYVYSPKLKDAAIDNVLVHIWHGDDNDDIDRIWYQTVGSDPEIMVDDTNFDGQPDKKIVWKNQEIIEMYFWEDNKWQRKEKWKDKEVNNKNP